MIDIDGPDPEDGRRHALAAAAPLFHGLEAEALRTVEAQLEWLSLPGGWTLFEQGDTPDALYIVTSGRLGAFVNGTGGDRSLVGEITAGEVVGEMGLITGAPRSATVAGLRDTTLLRLSKPGFDRLMERHPRAMMQLTRLIVRRLERAIQQRAPTPVPKTFTVLPLAADDSAATVAAQLAAAFGRMGLRAHPLRADAVGRSTEWFHNVETKHDVIVYQAEASPSPWTQLCVRQADCILMAVRATDSPERRFAWLEEPSTSGTVEKWAARRELVLLHDSGRVRPHGTARWLAGRRVAMHHHVRVGHAPDFERLARLLTGRGVGVVLSGGAARGCAHLGVVRALREAGVPIDLVGGASMGAIVAALVAQDMAYDEMLEAYRRAFVDVNPLNDYTLPIVALVSGRKTSRLLRQNFADLEIEDLWRNFYCVSSNLTSGCVAVHTSGPLWRWLRASVALPGILPPVVEQDQVFVDGGVMNNLPVDVMRALRRGPVIGVDVGADARLEAPVDPESLRAWSLLWANLRRSSELLSHPNILRILWRAGTVSSSAWATTVRQQVDLLVQPKLASIDMLDWKAVDRAVDIGYRHAAEQIEHARQAGETADLFCYRPEAAATTAHSG